jgi:hypothetical protein
MAGPTSVRRCACAPTPTPRRRGEGARFGAEGIGLCRTEHMFFEERRIDAVREMILAETARPARRWRSCSRCSGGLRGDLPRDGRAAGHHPPARPAAARVPAARQRGDQEPGPKKMGSTRLGCAGWSSSTARRTRCSGTAAVRLGSPPGDHADAGAGDLRGRRQREARASNRSRRSWSRWSAHRRGAAAPARLIEEVAAEVFGEPGIGSST